MNSDSNDGGFTLSTLAERVSTKSALSPLIWLEAVLVPATLISATFDKELRNILVVAVVLVLALIATCYVYFMLKNPSMLGSEDHQYRMHQLMGDDRNKGTLTLIEATPTANTHLDSSALKALPNE